MAKIVAATLPRARRFVARREFRRAVDEQEAAEPHLRLCLDAVGKTWPAAAATTRPATPATD